MGEQLRKIAPILTLFVVFVIAVLLGMIWGSSSVSIENTGLWQLNPSYQAIYVQAVADAYALDNNDSIAVERLSYLCQTDGTPEGGNSSLEAAFKEAAARYPTEQAKLTELRTLVDNGQVTQNPEVAVCSTQPVSGKLGRTVAPILVILIAAGIAGMGVRQMIQEGEEEASKETGYTPPPSVTKAATAPSTAAPAAPGTAMPSRAAPPKEAEKKEEESKQRRIPTLPGLGRKKQEEEITLDTAKSAAQAGAVLSASMEKTNFEAIGADPPLVQFMTTYLHGDDLYDDSFSIDTSSGEFLGETGIGISETIGGDETKHVAGLEVWLFDKNDIRTVTKVLMSDFAFTDEAIRAKLAPKGEAVQAKPGDKLVLETATLRIQARIVDFAYGSKPGLPPNSFFERMTIELAAWKRKDGAGSPPSPTGGLPTPPPG